MLTPTRNNNSQDIVSNMIQS